MMVQHISAVVERFIAMTKSNSHLPTWESSLLLPGGAGSRSPLVGSPNGCLATTLYGRRMLGAHLLSWGLHRSQGLGVRAVSRAWVAPPRPGNTGWAGGEGPVVWMKPPKCSQPGQEPRRCSAWAHGCDGAACWGARCARDCVWQEKGARENSDIEAKNLHKRDLNNRFSWKSPEDRFFIRTSGAVSLEKDKKMFLRQKRLSFCFNWKMLCSVNIPKDMLC